MTCICWIIKDSFYRRQFIRQNALELTFSALAFTHQHTGMTKIIKHKVIWG